MTAKIKLSDLEYGVLNPIGDDTSDDSFDRRRSTMINYLHKVIGDAYSVNTLEKYNKFTGIVMSKEVVPSVITESPVDKIKAAEKESLFGGFTKFFSSKDVKTVMGYRVYIPELECRPAPKNQDDPIISTYQLMLPDKNYIAENAGFFGKAKEFEIGQIVGVVFADVLTLQDPRIVEAGEALMIDWTGEGETAQNAFEAGTPRRSGDAPHSGHADGNPATSSTLCSDAMNSYTPGENAEALRAWIRTTGGKVYEKFKDEGTYDDGPQLDNGGDISSEVLAFVKQAFTEILEEVPTAQRIKISGANDAYHQCKTNTSLHRRGLAVDFTLEPATAANVEAVNQILLEYTAGTYGKVRFKNEYDPSQTTGTTTGDHFHVQIGGTGGSGGSRNLEKAQALLSAGRIQGRTVA